MNEYEVILILQPQQFHMINFPLTDLEKLQSSYQLDSTLYKPISQQISMAYSLDQSLKTDQLAPKIQFESNVVPNRTYYTLAKLDEEQKRIYLYPIANFQQMKPKLAEQEFTVVEEEVPIQQSQANQLLYQRNKAKIMEQQKQHYKWQAELKDKEESMLLIQAEIQLPTVKNVNQSKQMAKTDYDKYIFQQ